MIPDIKELLQRKQNLSAKLKSILFGVLVFNVLAFCAILALNVFLATEADQMLLAHKASIRAVYIYSDAWILAYPALALVSLYCFKLSEKTNKAVVDKLFQFRYVILIWAIADATLFILYGVQSGKYRLLAFQLERYVAPLFNVVLPLLYVIKKQKECFDANLNEYRRQAENSNPTTMGCLESAQVKDTETDEYIFFNRS